MAVFRYPLSTVENNHPYMDLMRGLHEHPRRIPSKYFYDDRGSRLFERITELEDYYPTGCENEILKRQSHDILTACGLPSRLNIVELGAGDGRKTAHLLKSAQSSCLELTYRPVDISMQALIDLQSRLHTAAPGVTVIPQQLDMEHEFSKLPMQSGCMNLVLYLGSSIGNFNTQEQTDFLLKIKGRMRRGDHLLTGFDLKKDPSVLQKAYDDAEGVTRAFNLNLLERLNRDLHADFKPKRFKHVARYNPATGAMESWLVSLEEQNVRVGDLDMVLHLDAFEAIQTETSWKFSAREIKSLARATGFTRVAAFYDHQAWFCDELWKLV